MPGVVVRHTHFITVWSATAPPLGDYAVKHRKALDAAPDSATYRHIRRQLCSCSHCKPNRSENAKRHARPDRYKNHRR